METALPDLMAGFCQAPFCPVPERVAPSHWVAHLPFAFWLAGLARPKLFVELGTYTGVSFCAFCQQFERLGIPCEAYAVDLWQGDAHMGRYEEDIYADLDRHISQFYPGFASLVRMSFDAACAQFQDQSIDLLHIDGCHDKDAMLHDFETWLPKMSARGIVLMHDIATRFAGYGGPAAWADISARFPSFAFKHGYGLGVVLVGQNVPPKLAQMAALDDFTVIAGLFQEQGKIYESLFAQSQLLVRQKAESHSAELSLRHAIADLEGQLSQAREYIQKQQKEHDLATSQLRDELLAGNLRVQAYEGSLSWKMTAPLRKLASFCRR